MKFLQTFLGILFTSFAFAQTGNITGKVTEMLNGSKEPVPFANVFIVGTTTGATTDFDGIFNMTIAPGKYQVSVSYTGYQSDTLEVEVTANNSSALNFHIAQKSFALQEVQIVAKVNRESETALLMTRQNASTLEENIGAQELSKKGAGDVQEGLTKLSGVANTGGGSISVRGLGDRYNNAYLNGIPLPSPDPDKKVIPLNIIPTSVVQSLSVSKTFSPEQYGDVSGASINIVTKDYPEEKTLNVAVGLGANSTVFGSNFLSYNGGSTDYLGFDDGTREIPEEMDAKFNQLDTPEKDLYESSDPSKNPAYPGIPFAKNFNPLTVNMPLNSKFSITYGDFKSKDDGNSGLGYLIQTSFESSANYQEGLYRVVNAQDAKKIDYTYQSSNINTTSSVLGSLYYRFNPNNTIKFNSMFVNLSQDQTRETDGYHFDYNNFGDIFTRRMTWTQNQLWTNQLLGTHMLMDEKLHVDWNVAYQITGSKEPDRRQLVWYHEPGAPRSEYKFHTLDRADQHRFFMYLNEQEINAAANAIYILKTDSLDKELTTFSIGYQGRFKNREQDFKFYSHYLKDLQNELGEEFVDANNPDNYINDDTHGEGMFSQRQESRPESANEGTLNIHSGYVSLAHQFNTHWSVIAGVRAELSRQEIRFRKQSSPLDPRFVESKVIDTLTFLPMVSGKYQINKKSSIRAVGAMTTTRPNFKELAPFQYRAFFGGMVTQGNPDLQNSINYNADLRYEIYPNSGDLFSVTAFGRYINSPIEQVTIGSASGILLTYQNAESAYAYGLEIEYLKKLRNIKGVDGFLRNFAVGANVALLDSRVNINTNSGNGPAVIVNNPNRDLQGASPLLVNADLSYEKRFSEMYKTTITGSYNLTGKKLYSVGRQNIGDAYEMSVGTLNLTWRNDIGEHWVLKASASNLLNPAINIEQESTQKDADGNLMQSTLINSYKRGVSAMLTVQYNIFKKQ